jgi:ribonuclease HI
MGKQKFYVVWDGVTPGIYTSWTECQLQVKGYDSAKYKSFDNREEAERAFAASPYAYIGKNAKKKTTGPSTEMLPAASLWTLHAVAIRARWSIVVSTWQAGKKFFISAR